MTDLNNPQELEKEPKETGFGHYIYDRLKDKKPECNCPEEEVCNATTD